MSRPDEGRAVEVRSDLGVLPAGLAKPEFVMQFTVVPATQQSHFVDIRTTASRPGRVVVCVAFVWWAIAVGDGAPAVTHGQRFVLCSRGEASPAALPQDVAVAVH
jgi:hypothetical protein